MDGMNLRGLVVARYGSISCFAGKIGWCNSKASRIVNGKQYPDALEIREIVRCLGITDPKLVMSIFLS